jgi:hypothetical protein
MNVWMTKYDSPSTLKNPDQNVALGACHLIRKEINMGSSAGYTLIGEATVEIKLFEDKEVLSNLVVALQSEIKQVKAECHLKVKNIEEKIQSLLAITNGDYNVVRDDTKA